jgi:hypothetical protein
LPLPLCAAINPTRLAPRVGTEVGATLLVTSGDNPHSMGSAGWRAMTGITAPT